MSSHCGEHGAMVAVPAHDGAVTFAAELAESLDAAEGCLSTVADALRSALCVDAVSISRIDPHAGTFEILSTAGASPLAPGTLLPVGTSSRLLAAAKGHTFRASRFAGVPGFDRPLDEVVLAAGFGSGCAAPVRRDATVVGAVALNSQATGVEYGPALAALRGVGDVLAAALRDPPETTGPLMLLCHDDPLVGHGLARLAEAGTRARTRVVATLPEAARLIEAETPDLIVCDDHLRGVRIDGFAGALRPSGSSAPLLVVASHDTAENRAAAARADVAAYVPRADAMRWLPIAVSTVYAGHALLAPRSNGAAFGTALTTREREVLARLELGLRMKQLAPALGISEATAKTHARNIFRKLGASSRTEAVREARRQGVLD